MVVRQVKQSNVFDIFLADQGWGGWVRVKRTNGGLVMLAGNRITKSTVKQIADVLYGN